MCTNSIEQRIIDLLQIFLQLDLSNATKDTFLPELDSVSFIELVVMMEIEFDIELYDEDFLYNPKITIQDWIDIIKRHLIDTVNNNNFYDPLLG